MPNIECQISYLQETWIFQIIDLQMETEDGGTH